MMGWIIVGVFLLGVAILIKSFSMSDSGYQSLETSAFLELAGFVLVGVSTLAALVAGMWSLF